MPHLGKKAACKMGPSEIGNANERPPMSAPTMPSRAAVHARTTSLAPLFFTLLAAGATLARPPLAAADDPAPPSQALGSDPAPPFPRIELSVDGAAIAFADYAARLELAPERWISGWTALGLSRRHGGDALLVEGGGTIWLLGAGLEGPWIAPAVGVAIAGPWNGDSPDARSVLRFGGDVGWQILWGDLAFALGAGAIGFAALDGTESVWVEPRLRAALGIVWR